MHATEILTAEHELILNVLASLYRAQKKLERGVCPAAADTTFDGINSGTCGGRSCWAVAGTFCGGEIQGTFAQKRGACLKCSFYHRVRAEEGTANLRTKFLRLAFSSGEVPLFREMTTRQVPAGERLFSQGQSADEAFIIQRGTCLLIVEKDGELHPTDHRSEGDIVVMTSVLTGEPRNAHVEAETDMEVWCLPRLQLEKLFRQDPDLQDFLTELVAERFNSRRPVADRTIGNYTATDIIGRGGFSIVYKGVHTGRGTPVAIKMLRHDMAMNLDFIDIFRNEARTHPYGHLLDQCVGCPQCEPETGSIRIKSGDLLLHTTDGLHDTLSEWEFTQLLAAPAISIEDKAESFLQAVLDTGGKDNITLVMARL
ncbi:MAG: cyclic nucleotide-binding domain-containing protein [Desulfosarcina sp.]|nr:cyclic nucleotide-binding domain-containing protein [Desulfobacterales bacterium]